MGCGDECPLVRAKQRDDWAITDPKRMNPSDFNQIRDQIEQRVIQLLDSFE
jgi:protein-tyrosine-phosphatase